MHLSICNLNIPIWHQATEGGEFDRLYTTSEGKMLSNLADKILRSWPNGWPKMGCRNSGTHFNASMMFLYPILIWKRPTGTSILFWNNLAQLNGKIKCPTHVPIQWVLHVGHSNSILELGDGHLSSKIEIFKCPGGEGGVEVTNWCISLTCI